MGSSLPIDAAALLVNECQRGLLDPAHTLLPMVAEQARARGIVPRIARLADAFRMAHRPVFFIHHVHRPDFAGVCINNPAVAAVVQQRGLCEGSVQVDAIPELAPRAEDHVVRRYSGMTVFYGNHLDSTLRNLGVRTLVAAGVSTNVAIPGIVLGGLDRGFHLIVAEDCIAGTSAEAHDAIVRHQLRPLARVVNSDEIVAALAGGAA
jgi:nicotinamidase-related amidase